MELEVIMLSKISYTQTRIVYEILKKRKEKANHQIRKWTEDTNKYFSKEDTHGN